MGHSTVQSGRPAGINPRAVASSIVAPPVVKASPRLHLMSGREKFAADVAMRGWDLHHEGRAMSGSAPKVTRNSLAGEGSAPSAVKFDDATASHVAGTLYSGEVVDVVDGPVKRTVRVRAIVDARCECGVVRVADCPVDHTGEDTPVVRPVVADTPKSAGKVAPAKRAAGKAKTARKATRGHANGAVNGEARIDTGDSMPKRTPAQKAADVAFKARRMAQLRARFAVVTGCKVAMIPIGKSADSDLLAWGELTGELARIDAAIG